MSSKGRTQAATVWQSVGHSPVYLDSAYKHLLRQQIKATALKNRTKVLHLSQSHLLKQIQNNQNKMGKLDQIKGDHSKQLQKLRKDREMKSMQTQKQKFDNSRRKENHFRQMSTVALERGQSIESIKREALNVRKENHKFIEASRQSQFQKKKQMRNKIHEDILESRATIKNFFVQKHDAIVLSTEEEVRRLNLMRVKEELEAMGTAGKEVSSMEGEIKALRKTFQMSRVGQNERREQSLKKAKHEGEEVHPLVRRIQNVMNKYTKFL